MQADALRSTVAIGSAFVLAWVACGRGDDPEQAATAPGAEAVEPAPDFAHRDLDGNLVRLADLRGKTVVIDFWATWCAPCVFQPPELNQLWTRHRDGGRVAVLGIEVGGATPEEVRAWGEENDAVAEYPLLVGADDELARRFGVMGYPATVIVAPDGSIEVVLVGLHDAAELETAIAPLVGSGAS